MTNLRSALFLVLLGLGCVPELRAQSRPLREELDGLLRASLAPAIDRSVPRAVYAPADQEEARLWSAFRDLRAAAGGGATEELVAAAASFHEVAVRRPAWPYAWLGLGLAKLRLDELGAREIPSAHQAPGQGWLGGAVAAFGEALRRDPEVGRAIAGLAEAAFRAPEDPIGRRALELLRRYSKGAPADPLVALVLARLSVWDDSLDLALSYIGRYLALGGDSSVADWELARIGFAKRDNAAGARHYYAAATRGGEGLRLLRVHLSTIASDSELAALDSVGPGVRTEWLRSFWARREVAEGRPAGSRLPVHFRRTRYARRHYASLGAVPQYMFEQTYRSAPRGLDDRGVIYIRHGEPDARATYVGSPSDLPNESWSYFRPTGNLVFHFARDPYSSGFRLLESLRPIVRDGDPLRGGFNAALAALYESRASLDPRYLRLAALYEMAGMRQKAGVSDPDLVAPELLERDRQRNHDMIALGTSTDSDPVDLERTWAPIVQVFGTSAVTRGPGGLLVAVALPPPQDLLPLSLPGGRTGYVLRVRMTAADETGHLTADVDSVVRLLTPRPLSQGEFLNVVMHYPITAGDQRVRLVIADSAGERGAVRLLAGIPVVDLDTQLVQLSDLILGREDSQVRWRHPSGAFIPLNPMNAWRRQDVATIAFDVGGLQPGEAFKVRLGIGDLGADSTAPPKTSVEFSRVADGEREFVTQSVALRTLRPGRYLLTATVTVGDRIVQRSRRITIVR